VEPESVHSCGDDTNEDPVQMRPRSHRTKGHAVTNVEEVPEGLAEEQVTRSETMPDPATAPSQPEATSSAPLMGQRESADPKDTQPDSPIVMMPSTGFPKQSPTTGLLGIKPIVVEVSPTLVPSSSSKKLDYSGDYRLG